MCHFFILEPKEQECLPRQMVCCQHMYLTPAVHWYCPESMADTAAAIASVPELHLTAEELPSCYHKHESNPAFSR